MKIMREMLKRRQFIFGKQNINRHQPYVDDVVIDVSDEDVPKDAVMKFCPTKKEAIEIIASRVTSTNVKEQDLKFVDTFVYDKYEYIDGDRFTTTRIGYVFFCKNGSFTVTSPVVKDDGIPEVQTISLENKYLLFGGPVLIYDGRLVHVYSSPIGPSTEVPENNWAKSMGHVLSFTVDTGQHDVVVATGPDLDVMGFEVSAYPSLEQNSVEISHDIDGYITNKYYMKRSSDGELS